MYYLIKIEFKNATFFSLYISFKQHTRVRDFENT